MTHRDDVIWAGEVHRGGVVLPPGWTAQEAGDGTYVVSGPCPTCLGDAYGPALDAEAASAPEDATLLAVDDDPVAMREILAGCVCGYAHGRDDGTGCGREWLVRVRIPEETS